MLSIAKMVQGQESYYLDLGREDYYLEGGEPQGRWLGKGAEALGLSGNVQRDHLRALVAGLSPWGGQPLGQQQEYEDGRERQVGWDLTFSAPKSVSVLWSQATQEMRAALQEAQFLAVREALAYLEEAAGFTRRGKGGRVLEPAEFVASAFEHGTSRAQDPQLHTHCLVMAATRRADGSWGQLHSPPLYDHKMAAGVIYRLALAGELRRLGFELREDDFAFAVSAVPEKTSDFFSKRRAAIEELLSELGSNSPKLAEKLARTSREVKGHVARDELFPRWQREGEAEGFGPEEARTLLGRKPIAPRELPTAIIREAVAELTDTDSAFAQHDLVRRVAEKVQTQGIPPKALLNSVRKFLADPKDVVSLGVEEGTPLYTSVELYKTEENLLSLAREVHSRTSHGVGRHAEEPLRFLFPELRDEQREAVRHLSAEGALKVLSGAAGTGKTTTLEAARVVWERAGYKVCGAALSARAAAGLEEAAGIKSTTIESLLYQLQPSLRRTLLHHARMLLRAATGKHTWKPHKFQLDHNTVLVIDEASMVGTTHLTRILREASQSKAKVVLVGDADQLQAIERGGGFLSLFRLFGGAELREIVRQRAPWMRDAVYDFAKGDARGGLARYAIEQRLHVESTREQAARALVTAWKDHTGSLSDKLILAGTKKEVQLLNALAQQARAGELGRGLSWRDQRFFEGDRVVFTVNQKQRFGVLNGDFGVVEKVEGDNLIVLLDRKQRTETGPRDVRVTLRARDLTLKAFGEEQELLHLGYASTVHKAQGATVDRSFVLAGGWMQDRELAYVQMSRARNDTHIFCDEGSAGGDLAELSRAMSRSRKKELAHDLQVSLTQNLSP